AEGGELAAEYREHFDVDSEGNWTHSDDEVEAAWAEYESGSEAAPEAVAAPETPAEAESDD
ncbi:MAG: 30S ribosomal protein S1, partial [Ilumatobacteraceae bacterium]